MTLARVCVCVACYRTVLGMCECFQLAYECVFYEGAPVNVEHDRIESGQCVIVVHVSISPYAKIENQWGPSHDFLTTEYRDVRACVCVLCNAVNHITTSPILATLEHAILMAFIWIRLRVQASFTWLHRIFRCCI